MCNIHNTYYNIQIFTHTMFKSCRSKVSMIYSPCGVTHRESNREKTKQNLVVTNIVQQKKHKP